MAKLNIEIELDWLTDGGDVDEAVKGELVDAIASKISGSVQEEIVQEAEARIRSTIDGLLDKQVNDITERLLSNRFDLTDRYGDVIEHDTSVLEQLKKRLDGFLQEKVGRDGRKNTYDGKPRIDWIIETQIDHGFKRALDAAAGEIKKRLEAHIETTLKAQIGESVAQMIGLKEITRALPDKVSDKQS